MMSDNIIKQSTSDANRYDLLIKAAIATLDVRAMSETADKCSAAIQLDQQRCEAYLVLSVAAYLMDDLGRAMELANLAHEASPDCLEVSEVLAHFYAHAGKVNDSIYYAKLGTIGESNPLLAEIQVEGLDNLPKAMNEPRETSYRVEAMRAYYEERYADAINFFEKELRLRKGDGELFRLFGHSLCESGSISRGLAAIQGAVHLEPDNAENYIFLAQVYVHLGDRALAKSCFNRALNLCNGDPATLATLSGYLDKTQDVWRQLERTSKAWFQKEAASNKYVHSAKDAPNETLSIGFLIDRSCVSDISRVIEPMFWHHDRDKVEYYVYSMDIPNDSAPMKLRNIVRYWLNTYEIRDGTLAATINSHNLDILIDLSVTDKGYRPEVIARQPARKSLRWFGPKKGLFSNGYDGTLSRSKKKKSASDSIMPIVLDPDTMPDITGESPCHSMDYLTFGASCDLSRLTSDVAMVWGDVLRSVPGSRLKLGNSVVIPEEVRTRCYEMFTAAGIHDRIDFESMSPGTGRNLIVPRLGFMVSIDVYLDAFPSNGFVELADALWAGVPVVTLQSTKERTMAGAILKAGDHDGYIARNTRQYIDNAVHAANAVSEDKDWRTDMHRKVRKSALYNPEQWGLAFFETLQATAKPESASKSSAKAKSRESK